MIARIIVTPKKSVLDPQGEAVRRAIHTLGMDCVTSTRVGKYIELEISGSNVAATRAKLEEISRDLLSNPVVEDYHIELDAPAAPAKAEPVPAKPAKTKTAAPLPAATAPAQVITAPVVKDGKNKPAKAVEVKAKASDSVKKIAKKSETKVAKTVSKKK